MRAFSEADANAAAAMLQHWYGIATFLRCPFQPDFKDTDIGLIGVPYSGGNNIERMQYLGPRAVRNRSAAYHKAHRQFRINPFELVRVCDLGDAPMPRVLNPAWRPRTSRLGFRRSSRRASRRSASAAIIPSPGPSCAP